MATVKNLTQFLGVAGRGIKKNALTEEGINRLVGNAVSGVMWGGGIGGVSELVQGGSFWEGAKSGAIRGAEVGAGATMLNNAARGFRPNASGFKGTTSTLSKQLKAVMRNTSNLKNVKM